MDVEQAPGCRTQGDVKAPFCALTEPRRPPLTARKARLKRKAGAWTCQLRRNTEIDRERQAPFACAAGLASRFARRRTLQRKYTSKWSASLRSHPATQPQVKNEAASSRPGWKPVADSMEACKGLLACSVQPHNRSHPLTEAHSLFYFVAAILSESVT